MQKKVSTNKLENGSFRDPSGFIFSKNNEIYRQVNKSYKENFEKLMGSGLYRQLEDGGLIIPHKKVMEKVENITDAYAILKPEMIPFISYPYEWSFGQLKDAALLTLTLEKMALDYDMSLKDASAYNIQFYNGRPILIDTLSFEKFSDKKPWVAYRQFCQHFLAPLLLASLVDIRLIYLLRFYLDGIPLDLASRLLPKKTIFDFSILSHIHFHARNLSNFDDLDKQKKVNTTNWHMGKNARYALVDNLKATVQKLEWSKKASEWGDYYSVTNYSKQSFSAKKMIIDKYIEQVKPKTVWDLGGNVGEFSRIASDKNIFTVSFDIDPLAVERNYSKIKEKKEKSLLPLVIDLTNPSPGSGWASEERKSLIDRGPCDLAMVLALIHHLGISNNLPFSKIAHFLNKICNYLIIEFVPKEDSQVQKLLRVREDIFEGYNKIEFEKAFANYFTTITTTKVSGSLRSLYLMKSNK